MKFNQLNGLMHVHAVHGSNLLRRCVVSIHVFMLYQLCTGILWITYPNSCGIVAYPKGVTMATGL